MPTAYRCLTCHRYTRGDPENEDSFFYDIALGTALDIKNCTCPFCRQQIEEAKTHFQAQANQVLPSALNIIRQHQTP